MTLNEYFTEEKIISKLISYRIKFCLKEDEKNFFKNFNKGKISTKELKGDEKIIMDSFPSRKYWNKYRPKFRSKLTPRTLLEKTFKQMLNALFINDKITHKNENWFINLTQTIKEIQIKIDQESFSFDEPYIIAIEKSLKKDKAGKILNKTFRPIAKFSLVDNIIISLTAKYLVDYFDESFIDDFSFAFRSKKKGRTYSHHEAIQKVLNFIEKNKGERFYVAECDIKKFYDSIEHSVIRRQFEKLSDSIENKKIDSVATKILDAYLNCYSFNKSVLANSENIKESNNQKIGDFEWIKDELAVQFGNRYLDNKIGVPQGGAISCFLSNLILDYADKEIEKIIDRDKDLYVRYCDDMIIISVCPIKAKILFDTYIKALHTLYLIPQKSTSISDYSKEFWSNKDSKEPYLWNEQIDMKSVPWLNFLGYQIKNNGILRVRKSSVAKEIKKQNEVCSKIIRPIRKNLKYERCLVLRKKQIIFRAKKKLISMSVGRVNQSLDDNSFCWVDGFKLCLSNKTNLSFAKQLDRNRHRQIGRIKKIIEDAVEPKTTPYLKKEMRRNDGFKQSYYRQFIKKNYE